MTDTNCARLQAVEEMAGDVGDEAPQPACAEAKVAAGALRFAAHLGLMMSALGLVPQPHDSQASIRHRNLQVHVLTPHFSMCNPLLLHGCWQQGRSIRCAFLLDPPLLHGCWQRSQSTRWSLRSIGQAFSTFGFVRRMVSFIHI